MVFQTTNQAIMSSIELLPRNDTRTMPTEAGYVVDVVVPKVSLEPWSSNWTSVIVDPAMNVTCYFGDKHQELHPIEAIMRMNPYSLEREYDEDIFNSGECPGFPISTKWPLKLDIPSSGFDVFTLIPSTQNLVSGVRSRVFSSRCTGYPNTVYRMFEITEVSSCKEEANIITVESAVEVELSYTRGIESQQGSSLTMELGLYGISGGLKSFKSLLKTDKESSRLSSALHKNEQFHIVSRKCDFWRVRIDDAARPLFDAGFVVSVRQFEWCVRVAIANRSQEMSFACAREFTSKYGLYYIIETTLGIRSSFVMASNKTFVSERDQSTKEQCLKRASEKCMGLTVNSRASSQFGIEACVQDDLQKCEENLFAPSFENDKEQRVTFQFTTGSRIVSDYFNQNFTPLPLEIKVKSLSSLLENRHWTESTKYGIVPGVNITGLKGFLDLANSQYCIFILDRPSKECQTGNICKYRTPCTLRQYCVNAEDSEDGAICYHKEDQSILYRLFPNSEPAYDYFGRPVNLRRLESIFAEKRRRLEMQKQAALEKKAQEEKMRGPTKYSGSSGDALSAIKLGPKCLLPGSWVWCIGRMV